MPMNLRQKYFEMFATNCLKAVETTKRKNEGYTAGSNDPFSNFRFAAQLSSLPGKEPVSVEQTILSRMADKLSRFKSLIVHPEYATLDESITDTLGDLFVYANILQIYRQLGCPGPDVEYLDYPTLDQAMAQPAYIQQQAGSQAQLDKVQGPKANKITDKLAEMFNWNKEAEGTKVA